MEITIVKGKELFDIIQHINLLKVKFGVDEIWAVAPVLYATEDTIDIIVNPGNDLFSIDIGEKVILKFQKAGNEFLVSGEITNMHTGSPASITVQYTIAQK